MTDSPADRGEGAPPLLSIVVPTYNRAHLIPRTLASLQAQALRNHEILIVDDGSTDDTAAAVRPFLNASTRYIARPNLERAAARNHGASLARGRYVNFFDSDDLALPNHTAEAARVAALYPDAEWFHLGYEWARPDGTVFRAGPRFDGPQLNHRLAQGNLLSCNGVFVRRDLLAAHPFNEDRLLSASEDYELWLRLAARFPLRYSNTVTSRVVDHDQRSVRTINGARLTDRLERMVRHLEADPQVRAAYGAAYRRIRMGAWSYVALHLSEHRAWKAASIRYLLRAFGESPRYLTTRQCLATVRNLLLTW
jgi:glycosyltransferase involved in cell wall biosynthesis